jgi:uncharacterized protein DUF3365
MWFCRLCGVMAVTGAVLLCGSGRPGAADAAEKAPKAGPDKEAVERAREQVKMLDDLYKTAIVGMTKTYVHQQLDTPAAIVAAEVFDAMKKKGHHAARLVDASGKPKSKTNLPDTDFEKKAVKAIKGGKAYYDEVGEKDGKPVLRAATVVPAVMKTCATCHGVKEGTLLGAVVYEVPIK